MTLENSERGRANRRTGKRVQAAGRAWLQAHGAPAAEVTSSGHRGDYVTGIGDINVEITVEGWDQIGKKAAQAATDAAELGYTRWLVWKRRRGIGDMGQWWAVMQFDQVWDMCQELDRLRRQIDTLREVFGPAASDALEDAS
jgi:hypothetical protein